MRLCLSMIVKNESKIIQRCLESLKDVICHYVIHDTGSDDNTCEIIKDVLGDIDGTITKTVFVNFEKNRNMALEDAKKSSCDYILLIDADMELVIVDKPKFLSLTNAVYSLAQKDSCLSYHNVRLLNRSVFNTAHYVGVTHEYLSTGYASTPLSDSIAYMLDHCDGGSKGDKFVRDRSLLENYLLETPDCVRTKFYLAQTYRDLGLPDKSINMYRQHIKQGSWDEETWYSQYMIGSLLKKENDSRAIEELIKAFEERPTRAEPLAKLCELCREKKYNCTGYQFAVIGSKIKQPSDQLFVDMHVYVYSFLYEISILAYYLGKHTSGKNACNVLLLSNWGDVKITNVQKNVVFYTETPPDLTHEKINFEIEGYNACNPSLLVYENKLLLNIRAVNYILTNGRYITIKDAQKSNDPQYNDVYTDFNEHNPVQTRNFRRWYNEDDLTEITQEHMLPFHPTVCIGFEDMRLFLFDNEPWVISTTRHTNTEARNEMVIGNSKFMHILENLSFCEKNWSFIQTDEDLCFIYSWQPFTVLYYKTSDVRDASLQKLKHYKKSTRTYDLNLKDFRLSSCAIKTDTGYLIAVHVVYSHHDVSRNYIHRIVHLDADMNITHITKLFKLSNDVIDYISSIAIFEDNFYFAWGKHDKEAYLSRIPLASFKKWLFKESHKVENQMDFHETS